MSKAPLPAWLAWAREIQAMCQTGLTYASTEYDVKRYRRLLEISAAMVEEHTRTPAERLHADFLTQPGYATPKVDVRGAVVREGKVLLVQERSDELWCLPGGWADVGETPSEMVAREVWEESGIRVRPAKVIGVYDANRSGTPLSFYHAYKVVFLCEAEGGKPRPSDETLAVDFFPFDALPPLSRNRTDDRHLNEVRAHLEDPGRPAAFD